MKKNIILVYFIVFFFVIGCSGNIPGLPVDLGSAIGIGKAVVDRPNFTDADEARMAQENARKFEAENKMWDDRPLEEYLTGITQKVVAVAKPRPFSYRIRIVNDSSMNAFTFGGGLLYVHAGLVARMENEAQLAMVLSHEIAHVTESHVTNGIKGTYGIQLLGELAVTAGSATGTLPLKGEALQKTYEYTMNAAINGHGRSQESEADEVGLDYLVKSGYDPREAPKTFEQLLKEYGDQGSIQNFFYGNHPTSKARIERTTELVKNKYSKDLEKRKFVVSTAEYKKRTRELVVETGKLDYEAKRFKTAAAMFEKALQVNDKDPISHYYLGKIALETGEGASAMDQAILHLTSATKVDQSFSKAYEDLGYAYYRKGDKPTAITSFERYLVLEPNAKDKKRIKSFIEELRG